MKDRDRGSIVQPAIDIAAIGRAVRQAHIALQDAERAETHAEQVAATRREEAARRRVELGRQLCEARKAWPAKGPGRVGGKSWGEWLLDQGIEERRAREWMQIAGYVESLAAEKVPATFSDVAGTPTPAPTLREAGIDKRPRKSDAPVAGFVEEFHRQNDSGGETLTQEKVSAQFSNCADTPASVPTLREAGIRQYDLKSDAPPVADLTDEPEPPPAPVEPPRPRQPREPHVWTDEERRAIQLEQVTRLQPPKMETREERTQQLVRHWNAAAECIAKARDKGLHLTDATTSAWDFESVKKTILHVARAALDELEGAGALDTPEPRQRHLSLLQGGNQ